MEPQRKRFSQAVSPFYRDMEFNKDIPPVTIDPSDFTPYRIEAEVREKFGIETREELYSQTPNINQKAVQAREMVGVLLQDYELTRQQKKNTHRLRVIEDFLADFRLFMGRRDRTWIYWLTQTGRGRAIAATILLILAFGGVVATQKPSTPPQAQTETVSPR